MPARHHGEHLAEEGELARALALAERLTDPLATRDAFEVLSNVMTFRGDLAAAREYGYRAAELARAAGDDQTLLMACATARSPPGYAGQDAAPSAFLTAPATLRNATTLSCVMACVRA
jgi:hypothetical protein